MAGTAHASLTGAHSSPRIGFELIGPGTTKCRSIARTSSAIDLLASAEQRCPSLASIEELLLEA